MIGTALSLLLLAGCPDPAPLPDEPLVRPPRSGRHGYKDVRPTTAVEAAGPALVKFKRSIDETDYAAMGFHSLAEVKDASLGDSLRKHVVASAALEAYEPEDDPCGIVEDSQVVDFLIMVRGDVRALMSLARQGSKWQGMAFGAPVSAKAVWTALEEAIHPKVRHDGAPPADPAHYFHLTLWGVNRTFLGYVDKGVFMLIPIQGGDGLDAGTPVRASHVFTVLGRISRGERGDHG